MLDEFKNVLAVDAVSVTEKSAVYRKSEPWVYNISFISAVAIKLGAQMPELLNMIRLLTLV
jgi:hypothetical protein